MLRSSMDTSTISIDADRGFPDDHLFMDPKHTSQLIESFFNFTTLTGGSHHQNPQTPAQ